MLGADIYAGNRRGLNDFQTGKGCRARLRTEVRCEAALLLRGARSNVRHRHFSRAVGGGR